MPPRRSSGTAAIAACPAAAAKNARRESTLMLPILLPLRNAELAAAGIRQSVRVPARLPRLLHHHGADARHLAQPLLDRRAVAARAVREVAPARPAAMRHGHEHID